MKILSAQQIREADAYTIKHEPIASIDLMERASLAFVHWFVENFDNTAAIKVFCGTGNNGGDGLAIARLLSHRGYHVEPVVVRTSKNQSHDFGVNYDRLSKSQTIKEVKKVHQLSESESTSLLIDALFGSGLTRPLEGLYAQVIRHINDSEAKVVSVDIPSGLYCDDIALQGAVIKADYTISFQVPKLAFFLPANYPFVGDWNVVDIGLDEKFIKEQPSVYNIIDEKFVKRVLKPKSKNDHKGTNGKALLIAGSYGKMGAAVLAAKAALRSGLGLLTIHTPHCGYSILQTSVPEAMVSTDPTEFYFGEVPETAGYKAIGIGCGLDTKNKTVHAFGELLEQVAQPVVIDADALNILAAHNELLEKIPTNSILTPHYKEFERLVGAWDDDLERISKQHAFAKKHNIIMIFKGANTTVALPNEQIYFNTTGNCGMAKGGSGDVLTGVLTGLLAQGYAPDIAAKLGVYLHGLAGDMALKKVGEYSLIASDIIEYLPQAYNKLNT